MGEIARATASVSAFLCFSNKHLVQRGNGCACASTITDRAEFKVETL